MKESKIMNKFRYQAETLDAVNKAMGFGTLSDMLGQAKVVDHDCHASPMDGCPGCAEALLLDHVAMDQDSTERAIKEHEDEVFGEERE